MKKKLYNLSYSSFVGLKRGYSGFRNRLRLKKFTKLINPKKNEKILEIGCNDAALTSHLAKFSDFVYGIDINEEQIKRIKDKRITVMSATNLKFNSNHFHKVCAFEVIEHILEIKKIFKEVYRVLKPSGKFIISFPFELIRGQTAIRDAIKIYKNPLYSRKLHVHKLTPYKIKKIIYDTPFKCVKSYFTFIPLPSFIMILQK